VLVILAILTGLGLGAAIAGGCNLGHSLVGVPLLSLGSITTTVFMFVGVWLADRAVRLFSAQPSRSKVVAADRVG
jgi:uncharacterized membrane protein YedE/YeeE